ncbi:cyclic AMP-dependent transcription factor ATF-4 isoform 2-T2 [Anableps anableps]
MTLSQLALEDMEALYLGSSFLMADHMGPLLDQDEEEAFSPSSSFEVKAPASPSLSFSSSYASSTSPYQTMSLSPFSTTSPPPSPPLIHSTKPEAELLPLSLLGAGDLLSSHRADDDLGDMDWMSEKLDLSDFDLESLIGSCSPESPSSPEDFLASLDSRMNLDSFDTAISSQHFSPEASLTEPDTPSQPPGSPPAAEDEEHETIPDQEVVLNSEPSSPHPSSSPSSPANTLELGSEVDIPDVGKMSPSITTAVISSSSEILQTTSSLLLSLPTTAHFVVLLSNKDEPPIITVPDLSVSTSQSSDSESDSGIESAAGSPTCRPSPPSSPVAGSSRTKPYCKPEPPSPKTPRVKSVSGAPKVVEKKLKKMEQNKTAATRYRQKKRVEQEHLNSELEELEKRNNELKEKAESISREIQYLKDLMEEVRKHHRGKTVSVA